MTEQAYWDQLLSALRGSPASGEGDWDGLRRLAQRLGVAPLLYSRLQRQPAEAIPPAALERLRAAYTHTAMRNARLYHYLAQVVAAFSDAGIPVILLKGSYLAKAAYGNIALRPMGDADILVPPEKLPLAAEVVQGMGYTPARPITPKVIQDAYHLPRFSKPDGIAIEIHGTGGFIRLPAHILNKHLAGIWDRSRETDLDGLRARVFSPEDQMLHLCMHPSVGHGFVVDLRPFFDIAQTIEHYAGEMDWDAFISRAREWGYLRAVCFTLRLAESWAGAVLPPEISDLITPDMDDPRIIGYVRRKILNAPFEDFVAEFQTRDGAVRHTVDLKAFYRARGYRFKPRFLLQSILPPVDTMRKMYPATKGSLPRLILAYPARLAGAMLLYCKLLWRCIRGEIIITSTIPHERRLRRLILN